MYQQHNKKDDPEKSFECIRRKNLACLGFIINDFNSRGLRPNTKKKCLGH
ncbi:hypothetical protein PFDG_05380 [Plasmodium falciparum Dd2]|uniref:Uncharacterized protein n=1 Tax=Plasmodium falciparum (isolate Dd2) TaxID=57267 RepID=A0A0L7MB80_PLAF4|nr:hypothetical protein PFDG_05380 [Plasmodium falciparum Dd2]